MKRLHPGDQAGSGGFTLIELMLGLAIVGLLTVLALPDYRAFQGRGVLHSAIAALSADILFARNTAITRNRPVVLCKQSNAVCTPNGGWEQGWLIYVDEGQAGVQDHTDPVIRRQDGFGYRLSARGNTPVRNRISFRADGSLAGLAGAMVFCDSRIKIYSTDRAEAQVLVISTNGRLRTVKGDEYASITNCEAI